MATLGQWLGDWAGRWFGRDGGEAAPHVIEPLSVVAHAECGRPTVAPVVAPTPALGAWHEPYRPPTHRISAFAVVAALSVGQPRVALRMSTGSAQASARVAAPVVILSPMRPAQAPRPQAATDLDLMDEDDELMLMD